MKIRFLIISLMSFVFLLCVEAQSLKVKYLEETEMTIQMNANSTTQEQKSVSSKEMLLVCSEGKSLYSPFESLDKKEEELSVNGQPGMQLVMLGSDVRVYKNLRENYTISEEYIMDRKFLIEDKLVDFEWQLIDEEAEINGFKCKKATLGDAIVWYCTDIPVDDGPYIFWGLPGLIIKLEVQNKTVIAQEVVFVKEVIDIAKPESGKKVSRDEFNRLQMKKMKEIGNVGNKSEVNINVIKR